MNQDPTPGVPKVTGIDLEFRPRTYFLPAPFDVPHPAHILGHERRNIARARIAAGDTDLPPELLASKLDDETREAIGRIHPAFMGGEYLPKLRRTEVEIARISLISVTADQISVRVRRLNDRLAYRIVDEYPENGLYYKCRPGRSKLPLKLAELAGMIDGGCAGGVVFAPLARNVISGTDAEKLRHFVQVSSEFYPQLARYYACRIDAWLEGNLSNGQMLCTAG